MEDLSLHILDIAQNSIAAEASRIDITIKEDIRKDLLSIEITDNGAGLDSDTVSRATDPFYTTRKTRDVGLGLALFNEAVDSSNGNLTIKSQKGKGTKVKATFQLSNIDRRPMGNIGETLLVLIIGNPKISFSFLYQKNSKKFSFDTELIKNSINGHLQSSSENIRFIAGTLNDGLKNLGVSA